MNIKMNINISEALAGIEDASEIIPELSTAVRDTAFKIEGTAKRKAPVDTGRLRGSITTDLDLGGINPSAEIGTNVEYAEYVEYGTYKMAAKPFLNPAYDRHIRDFEDNVSRIVRRIL